MSLHRTPVHTRALRDVSENKIGWRDSEGVSGGFTLARGYRIHAPAVLVALWELKTEGLLAVDGAVVEITPKGRDRLTQWTNADSTVFARAEAKP